MVTRTEEVLADDVTKILLMDGSPWSLGLHYKNTNELSKSRVKDAETERTFFRRNKDRMNYHELVERALPIGSGPVGAACKMIVKSRFCQSGMRRSISGGQNVMNLRVIQKSNQWEKAWGTYRDTGGHHTHHKKIRTTKKKKSQHKNLRFQTFTLFY